MGKMKDFVMKFNLGEFVSETERFLGDSWYETNRKMEAVPKTYSTWTFLGFQFKLYIGKETETETKYILYFNIVAFGDDQDEYDITLVEGKCREDILSLTNEQLWNMIVERL